MKKSYLAKPGEIKPKWYVVDATDKVVGRLASDIAMILMGKARQDSKVETYRAKRVEIRGQKPLPLHVDGNPVGYTPVSISIVPRALRVIVPPWVSGSLFKESPIA